MPNNGTTDPSTSSPKPRDEDTKEFLFSTDDGILSKASVEPPLPSENPVLEPEGLSFYNMDLYGSSERLDIFTEELPSSTENDGQFLEMGGTMKIIHRTEEEEYDLYSAQVSEMAKQYGMWDEKDETEEEIGFPTQESHVIDKGAFPEGEIKPEFKPSESSYSAKKGGICKSAAVDEDFPLETHESLTFQPCFPSESDSQRLEEEYISNSDDVFHEKSMHLSDVVSAVKQLHAPALQKEVFSQWEDEAQEDFTMDSTAAKDEQTGPEEGSEDDMPDVYCIECKLPIRAFEKLFGIHKDHNVTKISNAAEDIKTDIHKNMCKLEEQIAQMENFASHLEEIFITVEENFGRQEQNLEQHYNEVIQTLTQRYEEKTSKLEEEKKQKLESLYGQLIDCGKTLDVSKEMIENAQEIYRNEEKIAFLEAVVPAVDRLKESIETELDTKLSASMEFENSEIDFSDVRQMMDSINIVPAPSAPVINPQSSNSGTSTSVRVCWSLFSDDTVEYYELYYKPVLENVTADENEAQSEAMVKVKETYYTVTNLEPNTQYEFWVTALNTTGISPASERAVYMTVPSPPVILSKECRSCPNAALIRWESGNTNPVDSYTVELCELTRERNENTVTESIVGIPTCESLIQLQSGRHYIIYVRAVNIGGPSDGSQPITIHTTGTFFHLNEETAHPSLSISEDGFTMFYGDEYSDISDMNFGDNSFARCVAIMGELIPVKGKHYWEVEVEENTEYRIGVAYEDTQRNGYLGGNNTSWCMRHIITPSRHKYEFLHNGASPDIRISIPPKRIGVLLDYDSGNLSFFNTDLGQHLHTYKCQFLHYVHPCFALDKPGALTVHNGIESPDYVHIF
ncbi:fibronectin type III and SPRY domain-containing protein 2 [Erpetoichthys calabaricus]|uniref:fibronectin type III and SPRY domain-containing protein 2 n=1 Tax=Erpetoichthys calabaricus TaxID=27687 RepID=UPI0010A020C8|nr:fibronectin type III and SPRY domain-containing protein 2 [Erpetoichthys calabaricus]